VSDITSDTLMKLPEELDLAAAESFLESMRRQADSGLCLDASEVRSITSPCVQIVLAAARSRQSMEIQNPSPVFLAAFDDLGIDWAQEFTIRESSSPAGGQPHETSQAIAQEPNDGKPQDHNIENERQPLADDSGAENDVSQINPQRTSESTMAKRILTIDDSKTMRDMLMLTLAEAGFDVLQAVDGQNGLDVLGDQHVDVIITDINMPIMDGYEVIRRLRLDPNHKTTPILVLTTESEAEKKNMARAAGATGWMVKPFDPDRLVATVRKVAP